MLHLCCTRNNNSPAAATAAAAGQLLLLPFYAVTVTVRSLCIRKPPFPPPPPPPTPPPPFCKSPVIGRAVPRKGWDSVTNRGGNFHSRGRKDEFATLSEAETEKKKAARSIDAGSGCYVEHGTWISGKARLIFQGGDSLSLHSHHGTKKMMMMMTV